MTEKDKTESTGKAAEWNKLCSLEIKQGDAHKQPGFLNQEMSFTKIKGSQRAL